MHKYIRSNTSEYVHLIMRGHFRSRNKDGGHTIFAIFENSMLHAKSTALCFIEPKLLRIEVLHYVMIFSTFFAPVTLTLTPYELDLNSFEIYRICEYELPTSRLSKVIV